MCVYCVGPVKSVMCFKMMPLPIEPTAFPSVVISKRNRSSHNPLLCLQDFLLSLGNDPRLPPDLRIIFFDPRWCLTKDDADTLAADLLSYREVHSVPAVDNPNVTAMARDLSDAGQKELYHRATLNPKLKARNPHIPGSTRAKKIEDAKSRAQPTVVLFDLVTVLIAASRIGMGHFVCLSYNCTKHTRHYDSGNFVFAMTKSMTAELHSHLDEIEGEMTMSWCKKYYGVSVSRVIERLLTNRDITGKDGEWPSCRVYPTWGHLMRFGSDWGDSDYKLTAKGTKKQPQSTDRHECWAKKWCGQGFRHSTQTSKLLCYAPMGHNEEYLTLEFADKCTNMWESDWDDWWLAWMSDKHLVLDPDEKPQKKPSRIICVEIDSKDKLLYDYSPFDMNEWTETKHTKNGRARHKRAQRKLQNLFNERMFTSDLGCLEKVMCC